MLLCRMKRSEQPEHYSKSGKNNSAAADDDDVTRLDSHFRSLVALTNWMRSQRSSVSQALRVLVPSKSVHACRIVTNFWQFVDGSPRNIHSISCLREYQFALAV